MHFIDFRKVKHYKQWILFKGSEAEVYFLLFNDILLLTKHHSRKENSLPGDCFGEQMERKQLIRDLLKLATVASPNRK